MYYVHVYMYVCTCMYVCIHVCILVCMYIYVCMYVCMYLFIYLSIYQSIDRSMIYIYERCLSYIFLAFLQVQPTVYFHIVDRVYSTSHECKQLLSMYVQDELERDRRVNWVITFYAAWSPQCLSFAPIFAELSSE